MDSRPVPDGGPQAAVLFVSRRNALRSVLSHACLRHVAPARFSVASCGVPGQLAPIDPAAVRVLGDARIALPPPPQHDWRAFLRAGAPRIDIVILLDPLADVDVPRWPGQPDTALWSYPDLAARGDAVPPAEVWLMLHSLRRRLEILANLPMRGVDRAELRSDLRDIAHSW